MEISGIRYRMLVLASLHSEKDKTNFGKQFTLTEPDVVPGTADAGRTT